MALVTDEAILARIRAEQAVSQNVRVQLAKQRRTGASVARKIGMEPRAFRQRTRGEVTFSAAEIGLVARELDISADELVWPS